MSVTSVNPANHSTNEYYLTRQSQMESNVRSYPRKLPLAIAKALGCWVTDVEGTEYLDCLAGQEPWHWAITILRWFKASKTL